ncbi:MAG: helix-turn-helix domain-containing protein [Acidobacteria bacterium]|nr:helix-turn-helix domain-containing protein [Acidobacteriota bacterium]
MPERSFGRTVRYRRTKAGLSQAKLGELVGRSTSSVRSWERDTVTPNDPDVVRALAAVLALDERMLFDKAGLSTPEVETSPTVEQALATLRPEPAAPPVDDSSVGQSLEQPPVNDDESGADDEQLEVAPTPPPSEVESDDVLPPPSEVESDDVLPSPSEVESDDVLPSPSEVESDDVLPPPSEVESDDVLPPPSEVESDDVLPPPSEVESDDVPPLPPRVEPGYVAPRESLVITAPSPPIVEPSYMEDSTQRQMYRVRNLATIVLMVGLVIVLLWAFSNTLSALVSWWDDFFGQLRL